MIRLLLMAALLSCLVGCKAPPPTAPSAPPAPSAQEATPAGEIAPATPAPAAEPPKSAASPAPAAAPPTAKPPSTPNAAPPTRSAPIPGQSRPTGPCAAIAGIVPLAPVAPTPDPDVRWALYGVTLKALIQKQGWKRVVLGDKTVGMVQSARPHQIRQHAPDVQDQTLTALAAPAPRARLKNAMKLGAPVVFFGDQDWRGLFGTPCPLEKAWERFHALYPQSGGVTYLGNVGISDDGSQALVYVTWTGGKGNSSGRLAYLIKDGASWVQKSWVPLW